MSVSDRKNRAAGNHHAALLSVKPQGKTESGFGDVCAKRSFFVWRFVFNALFFFLRLFVCLFHLFVQMLQAFPLQLKKFTVGIQCNHLKPSYEAGLQNVKKYRRAGKPVIRRYHIEYVAATLTEWS